ncbi:hypothetical protein [Jiangella aurantiaca]|uniref:hypothetical protein n=1 Tax=Jiangella aurantiaca TaxID=2530373 RepID=UPI0013A5E996|nr:hypothetical protein [Jiangella aurantiaca]
MLGTYVYAPEHVTDGMRPAMMFVVVPLATLTGLCMWKQAAFRALLSRSSRRDAVAPR